MIHQALKAIRSWCHACRHRRQTVASNKLASGKYEMYVVCAVCRKRISPGVVLGKPEIEPVRAPEVGQELVTSQAE